MLREHWPDARIELICYPHIGVLARMSGYVDRLRSLDDADMAKFFSWDPAFTEEHRAFVRSFDLVISYLHDPGMTVKKNLLSLGAPQVIYGDPIVRAGHACDHLVKPLEELALYADYPVPVLRVPNDLRAQARRWLEQHRLQGTNLLALHAGSGSPRKNWPAGRYAQVAEWWLQQDHHSLCFIFGEADRDVQQFLSSRFPHVPQLVRRPLDQVAALLCSCSAFIGNDSGITHIAAAAGVPTLALFGPADPLMWGPRGERVSILSAANADMESLETQRVIDALCAVRG
jgi:hypothetical protein